MTPAVPPPPPAAQVAPAEAELTADRVKAKLKLTRAACVEHAAVAGELRERTQTKAHVKPT